MANIIKPRAFLTQLKKQGTSTVEIGPTDLLEITELGITIPLGKAVNGSVYDDTLKKAVSDFNSNAALNGNLTLDFDDLHTKYSEYIEVLRTFM